MKKSRLKLFKSTSMIISILGIVMIVFTAIIAGYIGISILSSEITASISLDPYYDKLAVLKSNYTNLESDFNVTKQNNIKSNEVSEEKYINAQLQLIRAKSAIDDVESAIKSGLPPEEIDARINTAKQKLKIASDEINKLK
ncbi:MAG: hypothetical protein LBU74_02960 [Methanobacteriaceae archaeon]|nr:hypothetical protein [Candidatus Methanorudis spinitermitis]